MSLYPAGERREGSAGWRRKSEGSLDVVSATADTVSLGNTSSLSPHTHPVREGGGKEVGREEGGGR